VVNESASSNGAKVTYLVADTFMSHFDAKKKRMIRLLRQDLKAVGVFGEKKKSNLYEQVTKAERT